jgi:hypothetical protein
VLSIFGGLERRPVSSRRTGSERSGDAPPHVTVETCGIVAPLGMVSNRPAGLGALDAGLVAMLQHSGVTAVAAAARVLLLRVAELWVSLVAGAGPALAAARSTAAAPVPDCVAGSPTRTTASTHANGSALVGL